MSGADAPMDEFPGPCAPALVDESGMVSAVESGVPEMGLPDRSRVAGEAGLRLSGSAEC